MPEIDPKLAQKVLDADLANMAKRVQEGKNLTANQRAHFMQATGQIALPESGVAKNKVCLLYTSPSPRDAHESRMPSSA